MVRLFSQLSKINWSRSVMDRHPNGITLSLRLKVITFDHFFQQHCQFSKVCPGNPVSNNNYIVSSYIIMRLNNRGEKCTNNNLS